MITRRAGDSNWVGIVVMPESTLGTPVVRYCRLRRLTQITSVEHLQLA